MPLVRRTVLAYSMRNRRHKAASIRRFMADLGHVRTLILCGGMAEGPNPNEGIVERIIASGADRVFAFNMSEQIGLQPWPFVLADGRCMPFGDDSADLVVSNAVIEHVGTEADQRLFIAEHTRVGHAWVISTPNRLFPIESHTSTVFLHWSARWRARVDAEVFTRLLSRSEFLALLPPGVRLTGHWWSPTFTAYYRTTTAA